MSSPVLDKQDQQLFEKVRASREEFDLWLRKNKRLTEVERECFDHNSIGEAVDHWTQVSRSAKDIHHEKGEVGWRRSVRTLESVGLAACRFFKDFKPFVDLVSNAGPYGALAIGVLSGLFALVESKFKLDDTIAVAMAGILDRLPGIKMLEEIYQEDSQHHERLRKKVIRAYCNTTLFGIASARYYMQSGFSRWWQATFVPEKYGKLAADVHHSIVVVRLDSEDLLALSISNIRTDNRRLLEEVDRLREHDESTQQVKLQELLRLSSWSPQDQQTRLNEYEASLERARLSCEFYEWMNSHNIEDYYATPEVKEWISLESSSMLLNIAYVHESFPRRDHSWISPLALRIIKQRQTSNKAVVHYTFDLETRTSIHTVINDLLYQLLRLQKDVDLAVLTPILTAYHDVISEHGPDSKLTKRALTEAVISAAKILTMPGECYMVIDRADRCMDKDQYDLMSVLNSMVEHVTNLKIFIVASNVHWELEAFEEKEMHHEFRHFVLLKRYQRWSIDYRLA